MSMTTTCCMTCTHSHYTTHNGIVGAIISTLHPLPFIHNRPAVRQRRARGVRSGSFTPSCPAFPPLSSPHLLLNSLSPLLTLSSCPARAPRRIGFGSLALHRPHRRPGLQPVGVGPGVAITTLPQRRGRFARTLGSPARLLPASRLGAGRGWGPTGTPPTCEPTSSYLRAD